MFGKAITYKTTKKCLVDKMTAKYEVSVGPAENLPPSVRRISKTLSNTCLYKYIFPYISDQNIIIITHFMS